MRRVIILDITLISKFGEIRRVKVDLGPFVNS